jgi:hypothetical protein
MNLDVWRLNISSTLVEFMRLQTRSIYQAHHDMIEFIGSQVYDPASQVSKLHEENKAIAAARENSFHQFRVEYDAEENK